MKKLKITGTILFGAALFVFTGCSGPVVKEYVKPSREKGQFLKIKTVAVFPFDNFTEAKDAEKAVESLLIPALYDEEVFEDVVDPRFVRDAMKKLKIISTDILDREQVKKLGDELGIQGIIIGKVVTFGKGKDKEAVNEVAIEMALVEVATGSTLWTGNVTSSGGLTMGKVFGVTPGESDIVVARKAVQSLVARMSSSLDDMRDREAKGIVVELRKQESAEKKRLEDLKRQSREIGEKIEQADKEAEKIRQDAMTEAESIKADIEMEKAAVDAEKSQVESEREAIEREKMELEAERAKISAEKEKIDELTEEREGLEEQINKLKEEIREESVGDLEKKMEEIEELEKNQGAIQEEIESREGELKILEETGKETESKEE